MRLVDWRGTLLFFLATDLHDYGPVFIDFGCGYAGENKREWNKRKRTIGFTAQRQMNGLDNRFSGDKREKNNKK